MAKTKNMKKEVPKTELEKRLEAELSEEADAASAEEQPCVDMAEELAARTAERDEANDQLLRLRAEFDNYRKRTLREAERLKKTAAEALVRKLLPVVDNLERALNHVDRETDGLAQGVEMVLNQLRDVLTDAGVEPIPASGQAFDPTVHEAMSHLPSDTHPAGTVMEEYERGYRIADYIVRPARVVVSSGPAQTDAAAAEEIMEDNAILAGNGEDEA